MSQTTNVTYKIQGSNDGAQFIDVTGSITDNNVNGSDDYTTILFTSVSNYSYYRIAKISSNVGSRFMCRECYLYGREDI